MEREKTWYPPIAELQNLIEKAGYTVISSKADIIGNEAGTIELKITPAYLVSKEYPLFIGIPAELLSSRECAAQQL